MSISWNEWLKTYELKDPEPVLELNVRNKHTHQTIHGVPIATSADAAYSEEQVIAHMAWHRRVTNAWFGYRKR